MHKHNEYIYQPKFQTNFVLFFSPKPKPLLSLTYLSHSLLFFFQIEILIGRVKK